MKLSKSPFIIFFLYGKTILTKYKVDDATKKGDKSVRYEILLQNLWLSHLFCYLCHACRSFVMI